MLFWETLWWNLNMIINDIFQIAIIFCEWEYVNNYLYEYDVYYEWLKKLELPLDTYDNVYRYAKTNTD